MNKDTESQADSIRSEIDATRQRMDETMEALGNRLQGRHLIDEILGLFRRNGGDGKISKMKDTVSHTATNAMHSVVDIVKAHPMPALLVGAGVAWMVYRSRQSDYSTESWAQGMGGEAMEGHLRYDPDLHYDRPLDYPAGPITGTGELGAEDSSKFSGMGGMIGDKTSAAKEKLGQVGSQAKEKMHAARQRAGELGNQARDKARETYSHTRDRVVTTADQHPLELGLGCLAVGLLIGLAIPTPEPVNRFAGETVDRLRERTKEAGREALEKGKRVAHAATDAVREEAEAQGLTPDRLADKARAVAEHTKSATKEAARHEGVGNEGKPNPDNPGATDPTFARRDM